jgi:predicted MFS family arabinose efflux permease
VRCTGTPVHDGEHAHDEGGDDGLRWDRNYTVLLACYLASFVWVLNNASIPPLLPLLKDEYHLSYLQTGLISTATMVIYCALQFPIGVLADRLGKRNVILIGVLWAAGSLALTALTQRYDQLLLSLMVVGMGNGMHFIPISTLLSDVFSAKSRGRALSIHGSAMAISRVVAPVLAIPAATLWGWRTLFVLYALLGFSTAAVFWRLVPAPDRATVATTRPVDAWKDIRAFFRRDLLTISLIAHLLGYAIMTSVFLPLLLMQKYGMAIREATLYSVIPPLAWAVGSPLVGFLLDWLGKRSTLILSTAISVLTIVLLVTTHDLYALVAILVGLGLGRSMSNPAILAYSVDIATVATRTSEMGLMNTFWVLGSVIGPTIFGNIADIVGLEASYLSFAVLPVIALVLVVKTLGHLS